MPYNTESVSLTIRYEIDWFVKREVAEHLTTIEVLDNVVRRTTANAQTTFYATPNRLERRAAGTGAQIEDLSMIMQPFGLVLCP